MLMGVRRINLRVREINPCTNEYKGATIQSIYKEKCKIFKYDQKELHEKLLYMDSVLPMLISLVFYLFNN